jgi:hypothetical protein
MKIRQAIAGAIVAFTALLGVTVTTAVPAQAATTVQAAPMAQTGTIYVYTVYHYQVCQRQGHFGASYYNPWSPYSWYCYDMSFPVGVTWAGPLDINGWCASRYWGTHAELWSNDVWGWRCVRRT